MRALGRAERTRRDSVSACLLKAARPHWGLQAGTRARVFSSLCPGIFVPAAGHFSPCGLVFCSTEPGVLLSLCGKAAVPCEIDIWLLSYHKTVFFQIYQKFFHFGSFRPTIPPGVRGWMHETQNSFDRSLQELIKRMGVKRYAAFDSNIAGRQTPSRSVPWLV